MRRAAAVLVLALAAASADAGWWDDAGAARRTTIAELRRDPDLWRDVTVLLDVRFDRVTEPGNSYFTRFTAADWRALVVVSGDEPPFERLFVRRGSECEERVSSKLKKGRIEIRCAVRDSAKGDPWVEVLDVTGDGDPLTPEEDAALARGRRLITSNNPVAAEDALREFAARRVYDKPTTAAIWRDIGAAAWNGRRIPEAAEAFKTSLAAAPDEATAARLTAAREAIAVATAPPPSDLAARRLLPPAGFLVDAAPLATEPAAPPPAAEPQKNDAATSPQTVSHSKRDKSVAQPPRAPATVNEPVASAPQTAAPAAAAEPPPPPPGPPEPPPPPPPPPPARRGLSGPK